MHRDFGLGADAAQTDAAQHLPDPDEVVEGLEPTRQLLPGRDFIDFYGRSWLVLHSYARRLVTDPFEAEEIVQDAFLKLFIAMPELENEGHALAFMRTTIRNLCIDRYRKNSRRPAHGPLGEEHHDIEADDGQIDPVVAAEDAVVIREALSKLKWEHREALIAWEIEGASTAEIAQRIGVDEKNVKHTLNRARGALRKLLVGSSVDPEVDLSIPEQMSIAAERARPVVVRSGALMLACLLAWRGVASHTSIANVASPLIQRARVDTPTLEVQRPRLGSVGKVTDSRIAQPRTAEREVKKAPRVGSKSATPAVKVKPTVRAEGQLSEVGGSIRALARPRVSAVAVDRAVNATIARGLAWTYSVSTNAGVIILNQDLSYSASGLNLKVEPTLQMKGALVRAAVTSQDVAVTVDSGNVVIDANLILSRTPELLVALTGDTQALSFDQMPSALFLHVVLSPRLNRVISQSIDV